MCIVYLLNRSVEDFDLHVLRFTDFGKEFPKSQNMSPDAFIQLALQLTYYKLVTFPGGSQSGIVSDQRARKRAQWPHMSSTRTKLTTKDEVNGSVSQFSNSIFSIHDNVISSVIKITFVTVCLREITIKS